MSQPRYVPLIVTGDDKQVEAVFDRLEKRADRLETRLKASTAGLTSADVRALQNMSRDQARIAKEADQLAQAARQNSTSAAEAKVRAEHGITADIIKRRSNEEAQAVEAAAKRETAAVTGAQKLIRAEYGITADLIQRRTQRTAEEQAQAAAEFNRENAERMKRARETAPAGALPFHQPFEGFERAEAAKAASKITAAEAKKRAAEVQAIEAETTRQAAQQMKLRHYAAEELEKARVTLAKHRADELIKSEELTTEASKASYGEIAGVAAAALAVIVAVGAGLYATGKAIFGMAQETAALAQEISKVQAATQLSAETLTTLRFVAQANGIEFKTVADAVSRFEVNLVKGDATSKRMQKTLAALGMDAKKAAADPTKAFNDFLIAFAKLPPTADRAYIATQLFGQGGAELIKVFDDLAPGIEKATERARKFGVVMSQDNVDAALKLDDALSDLAAAYEGLKLAIGTAALETSARYVNELAEAINSLRQNKDAVALLLALIDTLDTLIQVGRILADVLAIIALGIVAVNVGVFMLVSTVLRLLAAFTALITGDIPALKEQFAALGSLAEGVQTAFTDLGKAGVWALTDIYNAGARVVGLFSTIPSTIPLDGTAGKPLTDADIARLTQKPIVRPNLGTAGGGGRKTETELQRLQKEYKKLRDEIEALQKTTSQEFELRFKVEALQRVKSDLESILKLRNEMRLTLDDPLPVFDVKATAEEQARQRDEIASTVESYQSLKRVFDAVRDVTNEQREAEEQLVIARKTQDMPVVGALTRAETDYAKAVRGSRVEIQQLAADVITTTRLRERAEAQVAETTARAYLSISADYAKREKELDESIARRRAFLQALRDPSQLRASVEAQIDLRTPKPPSELAQIADHAANIRANVARIALSTTGQAEGAPQTTAEAEARVAQARERWLAGLDRFRASLGSNDTATPPGAAISPEAQALIDAVGGRAPGDDDGIESVTVDTNALRGLLDNETVLRVARKEAIDARLADEEKATVAIISDEARLGNQLIDYDLDLRRARAASAAEREREARAQVISIQLLEDDLMRAQAGDEEILSRMRRNAKEDRLSSALDLKQQIVDIEDEIAHAGENSADRQRLAYLKARRDIIEADLAARDSIIASQVKIADATVYHADQVQARVLEHLASQKSITEAVGDTIISVYDSVVSFLDKGIDRLTGKVSILNEVLKAIVRTLVSSVFQRFLGGMSGTGGGAGSGGQGGSGGGGLLDFLGRILTGGRGSGGTGVSSTGGFAGGGGAADVGLHLAASLAGAGGGSNAHGGGGAPVSFADLAAQERHAEGLRDVLTGGASTAGTTAASTAARGLSMSSLATGIAPLLPLFGAQAGLALGGGRGLSGILGGGGGLVLGGSLAALLSPGLFGVVPGAMTVAGSTSAAFMASLYGFLTNPFTIAAAGAALVAAYFIQRSNLRRKNEKDRAVLNSDTYTAIIDVLNRTRRGDLTLSEALGEWSQIKTNYFSRIANYDSKTKAIAAKVWNNEFEPTYLPLIKQAAKEAEDAKDREARFIPTFAKGTRRVRDVFNGRVPGRYTGRDPYVVRVDGDETIINPVQRARAGITDAQLAAAGVPGYAGGTANVGQSGVAVESGGDGGLTVEVYISQGTETTSRVVKAVLRGRDGREITVGHVRANIYEEKEDGIAGDVEQVIKR